MVEIRDPYTSGHQKQVAELSYIIAKKLGLSESQISLIRIAGLIHDLGKITVPAEILSKPGKLTENEFGIIKTHPQIAYDILKVEFLQPAAEIIFQHHERLDGSGYPRGLLDKDISIGAKILAVADVVEAMASHRPYRPARGITAAMGEILGNKNILYDPQVVDICIELLITKKFVFNNNNNNNNNKWSGKI